MARPRTAEERRAPRARSDLAARVLMAIPWIAAAIFLIVQGGLIFTLGLIGLGLICLHELYALLAAARPVRLAGFLGLVGLLLAALYGDQSHVLLATVAATPVLFALTVLRPRHDETAMAMASTVLGLWWVGLALAHAVMLRELPHGDGIVVDVLVGTFLGDTAAMLGGRAFGSRRLAPRLSPGKTVEGLLLGIVTAIAAVWFAGLYQDWLAGWEALALGAAVALTAPLGDLFESAVKRDAGVKDSGGVFGPHGGALDRLDAVLFTAVAGYYAWSALA